MEEHTCVTGRCAGEKSLGAVTCLRGNSTSVGAPGHKARDIVRACRSFVISRVGDVHQVAVARLLVSLRPRQDHRTGSNFSLI